DVSVLRAALWPRPLDLRSRGARSDVRAAGADGRDDVHSAKADANGGRSPPGEDDARHAVRLHLHVPESAVGPRALLDRVQHPPDRATEADGPTRAVARGARGEGRRPGLSAFAPTTRSSPSRRRWARARSASSG